MHAYVIFMFRKEYQCAWKVICHAINKHQNSQKRHTGNQNKETHINISTWIRYKIGRNLNILFEIKADKYDIFPVVKNQVKSNWNIEWKNT